MSNAVESTTITIPLKKPFDVSDIKASRVTSQLGKDVLFGVGLLAAGCLIAFVSDLLAIPTFQFGSGSEVPITFPISFILVFASVGMVVEAFKSNSSRRHIDEKTRKIDRFHEEVLPLIREELEGYEPSGKDIPEWYISERLVYGRHVGWASRIPETDQYASISITLEGDVLTIKKNTPKLPARTTEQ